MWHPRTTTARIFLYCTSSIVHTFTAQPQMYLIPSPPTMAQPLLAVAARFPSPCPLPSYSCSSSSKFHLVRFPHCSNYESHPEQEQEQQPPSTDFNNTVSLSLSGMLNDRVEQLLSREDNRVLLDGLDRASQRVDIARRQLAVIQDISNHITNLQDRASEIAESQREIIEVKAMVEEAERVLSFSSDELVHSRNNGAENMYNVDDQERWESIKAASVSALVGSLAGVPLSFTQVATPSQLLLPLAINFISSALFGVTFRYSIRRNLDNIQLKAGTSAAFAFVKGLATLDAGPPLELNSASFFSHAFDGAIFISQNLLIFGFAAVSLDYCFKMRILSPFPILSQEHD